MKYDILQSVLNGMEQTAGRDDILDKGRKGLRLIALAGGFDSGDHLHPSAKAYEAMAECVPEELLK